MAVHERVVDERAVDERVTDEIRIMVVDPRRLIADALAALIRMRERFLVLGAAGVEDAVAQVTAQQPDVLVCGVGCQPGQSLDLVKDLRACAPRMELIIVADVLEPRLVKFVLDNNVGGLLLSDVPAIEIAGCLDQVAQGRAVLPAGWQGILAADRDDPLGTLSKRQMEVLHLLAEGCSYEDIASRLFISVNTVKFHVRSIFERLGVRNRMAAARVLGGRR